MNSLPPIFPLNFSIVLVLEGGKYSKSLNIVDLNLIFQCQNVFEIGSLSNF